MFCHYVINLVLYLFERDTGIGRDTLRVWERRYGRPEPIRLPSGHRRYTAEQIRWLRRVATYGVPLAFVNYFPALAALGRTDGSLRYEGVARCSAAHVPRPEAARRGSDLGADGGYILAPAHNVQDDTPTENILAIYEAVRVSYDGPAGPSGGKRRQP